jgi:hypothetical protein
MATIDTGPSTQGDGYIVPAMPSHAFSVTKSDVDVFIHGIHIYVGTSGDVAVVPENDNTSVVFKNFPSGLVLPVKVKKVLSTGTTASDLVGVS